MPKKLQESLHQCAQCQRYWHLLFQYREGYWDAETIRSEIVNLAYETPDLHRLTESLKCKNNTPLERNWVQSLASGWCQAIPLQKKVDDILNGLESGESSLELRHWWVQLLANLIRTAGSFNSLDLSFGSPHRDHLSDRLDKRSNEAQSMDDFLLVARSVLAEYEKEQTVQGLALIRQFNLRPLTAEFSRQFNAPPQSIVQYRAQIRECCLMAVSQARRVPPRVTLASGQDGLVEAMGSLAAQQRNAELALEALSQCREIPLLDLFDALQTLTRMKVGAITPPIASVIVELAEKLFREERWQDIRILWGQLSTLLQTIPNKDALSPTVRRFIEWRLERGISQLFQQKPKSHTQPKPTQPQLSKTTQAQASDSSTNQSSSVKARNENNGKDTSPPQPNPHRENLEVSHKTINPFQLIDRDLRLSFIKWYRKNQRPQLATLKAALTPALAQFPERCQRLIDLHVCQQHYKRLRQKDSRKLIMRVYERIFDNPLKSWDSTDVWAIVTWGMALDKIPQDWTLDKPTPTPPTFKANKQNLLPFPNGVFVKFIANDQYLLIIDADKIHIVNRETQKIEQSTTHPVHFPSFEAQMSHNQQWLIIHEFKKVTIYRVDELSKPYFEYPLMARMRVLLWPEGDRLGLIRYPDDTSTQSQILNLKQISFENYHLLDIYSLIRFATQRPMVLCGQWLNSDRAEVTLKHRDSMATAQKLTYKRPFVSNAFFYNLDRHAILFDGRRGQSVDLITGKGGKVLGKGHQHCPINAFFTDQDRYFISQESSGIRIFDLDTLQLSHSLKLPKKIFSADLSQNADCLAVSGTSGIRLWSWDEFLPKDSSSKSQ
ncbi:MAG: hypothetical protein ACFCBW_22335 [Candidatus Competibacterales bacterium]